MCALYKWQFPYLNLWTDAVAALSATASKASTPSSISATCTEARVVLWASAGLSSKRYPNTRYLRAFERSLAMGLPAAASLKYETAVSMSFPSATCKIPNRTMNQVKFKLNQNSQSYDELN